MHEIHNEVLVTVLELVVLAELDVAVLGSFQAPGHTYKLTITKCC